MNRIRRTDAAPPPSPVPRRPRGGLATGLLGAGLLLACLGFIALGSWQLQRMGWKRDLIVRVTSRVDATPIPAPAFASWPEVNAADHEYRRVRVEGRYLSGQAAQVQAVTEAGAGFWLLVPLRTDDGHVVLVNRGFVPPGWTAPPEAGDDAATRMAVTGLLRLDEPGGGFLRDNVPTEDRWYSRDLAAIGAARGLGEVAPYFIDVEQGGERPADAKPDPAIAAQPGECPDASMIEALGHAAATCWPRAGLTVVRFRDNHLPYALTWFALALMTAVAGCCLAREARRRTRPLPHRNPPTDAGHAALPHD